MHNYIWCPIHIPSFMIIGSVVSEELRWQDFGTDGRTDGRSDCTPRPAFAFGDAGKNVALLILVNSYKMKIFQVNRAFILIRLIHHFTTIFCFLYWQKNIWEHFSSKLMLNDNIKPHTEEYVRNKRQLWIRDSIMGITKELLFLSNLGWTYEYVR